MDIKELDIDAIHKAFSPAREIQNPKMFVGRIEEITSGISALMNRGGFVAIFGLRGVGKTSIAYQLKSIAEGNTELPRTLELENYLPKKGFNYIVHYFRSDGFITSISDLIKRMLFGDENNPSLFSLTKAGNKKLEEFKRTLAVEGSAGMFGAKISGQGREESKYVPFISDDLIQQFRALLGTIRKDNQNKSGLLLLIDEFDTIPDKSGFSSIVKACSSDYVKFGVIGIATNVSELIRDHSSIGRQIDFINIPLMSKNELTYILKRGEYLVNGAITFDDEAIDELATKSEGFPYFTHLLGKESMLLSFKRNSPRVTKEDIETLSDIISQGRLNSIYEGIYHEAVKNSSQREILLKLFAEESDDEIFTETVYSCAKGMNISNPSQLMKQLTTPDNVSVTPVLKKVREKYFRFTDPVFKVYAKIRSWKFSDI